MTRAQRQLIIELALEARVLADELRDNKDVTGENRVSADGIASDLEALDWELARDALVVAEAC